MQTSSDKSIRNEKGRLSLQLAAISGIAGPLFFLIAVTIGGLLDPTYSHISKTVSELMARGAPNKTIVDSIMILSSVAVFPLAVGLHKAIKTDGRRVDKIGPVSMTIGAALSLALVLFFPLDPEASQGNLATSGTMMHIALVAAISPLTMLAPLSFWRRLKRDSQWSGYDRYSFATFAAILVTGLLTAVFVGSSYGGLLERLTIGASLQWQFVMGIKILRLSTNK